jgi:hypothetical protein
MPNQNQNLRQTLVVSQDGKRIILPRNDHYKTPEIVFNNVPIGAVYEFLKPIERSTSQAIFRQALVKSYDSYFAASLVVGGVRGEAIGGYGETPPPPFNYGLTETVKGVGNNYVTLGVPRFTTSNVYKLR